MTLNLNLYRKSLDVNKDTILRGIAGSEDDYGLLTLFSLGSHVPIYAVIAYAIRPDMGGPIPELVAKLEYILNYYKYDEVIPWSDLPQVTGT